MIPLITRLNHKPSTAVYILNHPAEFTDELRQIEANASVKYTTETAEHIEFVLVFVKSQQEIDESILRLKDKLIGDAILWYAFPKKSSKKYKVEISRDNGWDKLNKENFVGVRAVAIDADWSALRFRRVEYIKSMTRTFNPA
jgi:hypothetical protein